MGGCRCTYRNCTVKSDGKTHMFHYPVFDKIRCHKWLLNANRLDFLNLKVSQLKNRVVCQHHFKDENFMNYKKDKLTFIAVPTEDGPYCDSSNWINKSQEISKDYPILVEDIENDQGAFDKRANFSIKYGDFLTNCDLIDFEEQIVDSKINLPNEIMHPNVKSDSKNDIFNENINKNENPPNIDLNIPSQNIATPLAPTVIVPSHAKGELQICTDPVYHQQNKPPKVSLFIKNLPNVRPKRGKNEKPKIKIISEKNIEEKITRISGQFRKLSPSYTITSKVETPAQDNLEDKKIVDLTSVLPFNNIQLDKAYTVQVEFEPHQPNIKENVESIVNTPNSMQTPYSMQTPHSMQEPNSMQTPYSMQTPQSIQTPNSMQTPNSIPDPNSMLTPYSMQTPNNVYASNDILISNIVEPKLPQTPNLDKNVRIRQPDSSSPSEAKILQLKNKLTPERVAAIEMKRNFNMKLRNMIEACLEPSNKVNVKKENNEKPVKLRTNTSKRALQSVLVNNTPLPDNTLAILEARMQKMENTLLNRIDQNTKQITDLKNTFVAKNVKKKDCSVQTNESEECYKKFLYNEIFQFLSPSSKSAVYEDLFINKSVNNVTSKPKRRRRS